MDKRIETHARVGILDLNKVPQDSCETLEKQRAILRKITAFFSDLCKVKEISSLNKDFISKLWKIL
jgi:uncharacterized protein YerC